MLIYQREDVSPSDDDSTPFAACQGVWVGGAGNLSVKMVNGDRRLIRGVAAGTLLPDSIVWVYAGQTTATYIQRCYAT